MLTQCQWELSVQLYFIANSTVAWPPVVLKSLETNSGAMPFPLSFSVGSRSCALRAASRHDWAPKVKNRCLLAKTTVRYGGLGRNRTTDTRIFNAELNIKGIFISKFFSACTKVVCVFLSIHTRYSQSFFRTTVWPKTWHRGWKFSNFSLLCSFRANSFLSSWPIEHASTISVRFRCN